MGQHFVKTLNKRAPLKIKVIRGTHKPFITKKIEKSDYETISFKKEGKYFK